MKKYLLLVGFLFLYNDFLYNYGNVVLSSGKSESISLVFVGDIMGHSPQFHAAFNSVTKTYDYDACFHEIKPYIKKATFAVANLEAPIAGKPFNGFPNFSSPDELLDGLKKVGFNVLLTANNHILDRGKVGLERTIQQIEKRNLYHVGSYIDEKQRDNSYPLILESKGVRLALLNCTYGTNNIKAVKPNKINYIDTLEIIRDIKKADKLGVDLKIMTIHWGNENELHSNKIQESLAKFLVNHGINLIIGSHPHVIQNAEIQFDKNHKPVPVFYSLGNCISNQRGPNTNGGLMVKINISTVNKTITSASYLPMYVYKGALNGHFQFHLIPTISYFSNPKSYSLNRGDSISLEDFDSRTRKRLVDVKLIR